jgi:hypothetical protein
LSKHPIPPEVKATLNLGPKFAIKPTATQIPYTKLICDVENIAQSFKLPDNRNLFRSKAVNILTNSMLRPERLGQKQKYLNNLYTKAEKYLKLHKNEICVLESDKSKKTIIMDRKDYEKLTNDHISGDPSYEKLTRDPTSTYQTKNNSLIKKLYDNKYIDKRLKATMTTYTAICPRIYFLPKLHKLDPQNPVIDRLKMRPIVSGINSPTSEISHFLANIIKSSIDQEKYNIKSSYQFKELITTTTIPDDYQMISLDVVNMFGNITKEMVKDAVKERWKVISTKTPIDQITFLQAVDLIFEANYFAFNDGFYKMKIGTTMGGEHRWMYVIWRWIVF